MYGPNDSLIRSFRQRLDWWHSGVFVYDDCMAKRQPIHVFDVAQCVLNALKLQETVGNTYELGGPHALTRLEMYEILFNIMKRPPGLFHFPRDIALSLAKMLPNYRHFNTEEITKDKIDILVNEASRKIDELCVNPVAFQSGAEEQLFRYIPVMPDHPENEEV